MIYPDCEAVSAIEVEGWKTTFNVYAKLQEKRETRKVVVVLEHVLSVDLVLPSFFPEQGIDTGIGCTLDLEKGVEVAVMEFAVAISEVVCDHQEELEQELGRRHRNSRSGETFAG
jgi:hypothetical protein